MTENITFWKTIKPFLSYKTNKTLIEEERFISKDHQIAKPFNEYFISTPIKNMPKNLRNINISSEEDPVSNKI